MSLEYNKKTMTWLKKIKNKPGRSRPPTFRNNDNNDDYGNDDQNEKENDETNNQTNIYGAA